MTSFFLIFLNDASCAWLTSQSTREQLLFGFRLEFIFCYSLSHIRTHSSKTRLKLNSNLALKTMNKHSLFWWVLKIILQVAEKSWRSTKKLKCLNKALIEIIPKKRVKFDYMLRPTRCLQGMTNEANWAFKIHLQMAWSWWFPWNWFSTYGDSPVSG